MARAQNALISLKTCNFHFSIPLSLLLAFVQWHENIKIIWIVNSFVNLSRSFSRFVDLFCNIFAVFKHYLFFNFSGAFDDPDVTHVEGEVDPVRDLDIISEELRLKDEDSLNKHLEKLEKLVVRGNDKKLKPEYVSKVDFLSKIKSPPEVSRLILI